MSGATKSLLFRKKSTATLLPAPELVNPSQRFGPGHSTEETQSGPLYLSQQSSGHLVHRLVNELSVS